MNRCTGGRCTCSSAPNNDQVVDCHLNSPHPCSIEIIWAGQRTLTSATRNSSSGGGIPTSLSLFNRYFSTISLNILSGFCSKNSGQVSQQVLQLTHDCRSITTITFINASLFLDTFFKCLIDSVSFTAAIFHSHGFSLRFRYFNSLINAYLCLMSE